MNEKIRIGIIGAGGNTKFRHIPGLQAIEGVEIVSLCNRSRESSERTAQQFKIPQIYETWQELVQAEDTDAIVIGTWPYLHCPATLASLEANKQVMCEARMAMNAEEARSMLRAARAKPHLVAQVVPSPFTLRVDRTIQRMLVDGSLGELLAIEVRSIGGSFLDSSTPLGWRQDISLSGLNVMTLGIWYEAVMRWVGEAKSLFAMGKTFTKMRKGANGTGPQAVHIPEHIDVVADMACGAQAHFLVSSVGGLVKQNEILLLGSEGTLKLSESHLFGGRAGDSELKEILIPPEEERKWRVEEEFIQAIRGKEVITHTTFADGVKYMEFTTAVAKSMAKRKQISLEPTF